MAEIRQRFPVGVGAAWREGLPLQPLRAGDRVLAIPCLEGRQQGRSVAAGECQPGDLSVPEVGIAFLHRMVIAAHFAITMIGPSGVRVVCQFLELCGVDQFVASSYGSQQSVTRDWSMPMHQTDSLPGKHAVAWKFKWGYQVDHHAINTVPKECLIRITKAEDGGIGARGPWEPVRTGFTPGQENEFMIKWLKGEHIKIKV